MIKNFEEIKSQLKDLSEVINRFKSEAVQLRIVELVFGLESGDDIADEKPGTPSSPKRRAAKRKSAKTASPTTPKKAGMKASGQGAVASLGKLVEEGFFSKPKSLGDIIKHCDLHLARKFKTNEFSGKLGRLVREGTLKRSKNAENQYEYQSK